MVPTAKLPVSKLQRAEKPAGVGDSSEQVGRFPPRLPNGFPSARPATGQERRELGSRTAYRGRWCVGDWQDRSRPNPPQSQAPNSGSGPKNRKRPGIPWGRSASPNGDGAHHRIALSNLGVPRSGPVARRVCALQGWRWCATWLRPPGLWVPPRPAHGPPPRRYGHPTRREDPGPPPTSKKLPPQFPRRPVGHRQKAGDARFGKHRPTNQEAGPRILGVRPSRGPD